MKATIEHNNYSYKIDFSTPIDISIPISAKQEATRAWYCSPANISPVMTEHFVGDVNKGGAVNFRNIAFNPHGNGTHTECVGHISKEYYSINQLLKQSVFVAQLVTITPQAQAKDLVITFDQIKACFDYKTKQDAFIVRTLPNSDSKKTIDYSNTNPAFVEAEAMNWLYQNGIRHFLIDTPSVDKEFDAGVLAAHHAFWDYPNNPRLDATITELIYAPAHVADGIYILNLQVAAFENDATPSKPQLYTLL